MHHPCTTLVYATLLAVTLGAISWTCYQYPLFPLQTNSLEWSNAWLLATVVDYYGSTLVLCGVVWSSSSSTTTAVLWILGCCLLGSPVACVWALVQLSTRPTGLRLVGSSTTTTEQGGAAGEDSRLV